MGCGSSTVKAPPTVPEPVRFNTNNAQEENQARNTSVKEKDSDSHKNETHTAKPQEPQVDSAKPNVKTQDTQSPANDKGAHAPPPPPPPPPPAPPQPTAAPTVSSSDVNPSPAENKQKAPMDEAAKAKAKADLDELKARCDEQIKLLTELLKAKPDSVSAIMRGNLDVDCPSEARIVRIFVSSTFTDTRHERNWLMEKVYPKLKTLCQSKGYDFQVVDMRWGIRDEAQDDHMTTEICLREVELCKQQSTGPCFVSLMSHKYGYRDFPRQIQAEEFEKLKESVEDQDANELLSRWFQLDKNAVPPTYVLQPISSLLPDTKSDIADLRRAANQQWNDKNSVMHAALAEAAQKSLDKSRAMAYLQSVSEAEIMSGLNKCAKERIIWFRRVINDIDNVDANAEKDILRKYRDLSGNLDKDGESKKLLEELEDTKMKSDLINSNVFEYQVSWEPKKGIDAENKQHQNYLEKLCQDAETHLTSLLETAFKQRERLTGSNPLFLEVLQHVVFCKEKCKAFHGRGESLKQIEDYLKGPSQKPFIIHGQSGCGKTSLVAMAAKIANQLNGPNGITIIRFIGTTADSSTLPGLLTSIINQLRKVLKMNTAELTTKNPKVLAILLSKILLIASTRGPLVILLDSLDQFDPEHNVRQLEWLPLVLPDKVKLIVSTLPEEKYEFLPNLKGKFKDVPENFMDVPQLDDTDSSGILDKWLEAAGRTLTDAQRHKVLDAFKTCPIPLFLKLSFDEACKWKSYSPPEVTVLQSTVRGCINNLFSNMETLHGKVFVSKALGYLTASKIGLSEAELDDILSCDDEVLGDVYRFWTPPLRRLPPLLLVRMKRDLGQYVVNRGADGKQVFYWYHRQFIEAARDRYCNDEDKLRELHEGLANFFSGVWAEGTPKPYKGSDGEELTADRHVAPQPIKFDDIFNVRKLSNMTHHWILAHQLEKVKLECLLNYDFLIGKLEACGLRTLLDDFQEARKAYPDDMALEGVSEALQLSQNALLYDLRTFPSQMLGRIRNSKISKLPEVHRFLLRCRVPGYMYLEPDRPILEASGGQLVHSIADHNDAIAALVLNKKGTTAVSCLENGTLKFYDIEAGKVIRTVTGMGKDPDNLRLAKDDTVVISNPKGQLCAYDMLTGAKRWAAPFSGRDVQFVTGGQDFSLVLMMSGRTYTFFDAWTGQVVGEPQNLPDAIPQKISFSSYVPAVGHEKYMVLVESDQKVIFVFDPVTKSLSHYKKVLQSYKNEKNEKVDATVDGLQISHDGETLYMANYTDNDLYFVETKTLSIIKSFPGCAHDFSEKFHLSADGKYLFFPHRDYVRVWDLATGLKGTVLHLPNLSGIEDVASVDMKTFITINADRTLKIWDISRAEQPEIQFEDLSRDHRMPNSKVQSSGFHPLDSPRYFLQVSTDNTKEIKEQIFGIFDTATSTYVCQGSHKYKDSDDRLSSIQYIGDWMITFEDKHKWKVLDLRTMKVISVLQGKIPTYNSDLFLVNGGKEFVYLSKGRMNVRVASRETGKTVAIIKAGQKKRIDTLLTNKTGTIVAAECEGPLLLFDMTKRTYEFEITSTMVGLPKDDDLYLNDAVITPDGMYFIFQGEYKIPKDQLSPGTKVETVTSPFVFSIPDKTLAHVLVDVEKYQLLQNIKNSDKDVGYDGIQLIDNKRLITTHNDYIVRVFDFTAGTLLHRLEGHTSYTAMSLLEGSNILVTNGTWDEEYAIRLWDMSTLKCFAVYRYEMDLRNVQQIGPKSCSLIGQMKTESTPLMFRLKGQTSDSSILLTDSVPESSFPVIFEEKSDDVVLDLTHPDDDTIDNDDPDTDEEEKDDDDDDDDDVDDDDEEEISDEEAWMKED